MSETRVVLAATDSCSGPAARAAAAAHTCSPLGRAMPSAVESTTTTAGLDTGGMRSSTERGDDDDDEQVARQQHNDDRRPPRARHAQVDRAGRRRRAPAATLVDASTTRSGTSGTPLLSSSKAAHLCGRRELRVESGKGSSRWLGGGAGGVLSDARTSTRSTCRGSDVRCASGWALFTGTRVQAVVSQGEAGRGRRRVLG